MASFINPSCKLVARWPGWSSSDGISRPVEQHDGEDGGMWFDVSDLALRHEKNSLKLLISYKLKLAWCVNTESQLQQLQWEQELLMCESWFPQIGLDGERRSECEGGWKRLVLWLQEHKHCSFLLIHHLSASSVSSFTCELAAASWMMAAVCNQLSKPVEMRRRTDRLRLWGGRTRTSETTSGLSFQTGPEREAAAQGHNVDGWRCLTVTLTVPGCWLIDNVVANGDAVS